MRLDICINGAEIIDGTGSPRHRADIGIAGDRIVAVTDLRGSDAARTIDAQGLIAAPGFIDSHTHDDGLLLSAPEMTPKVSQGVTTVVTGNCGSSLAPLTLDGPLPSPLNMLTPIASVRFATFREYLAAIEAACPAVNTVALVGHGTLRIDTMANLDRPANARETKQMLTKLVEALDADAAGLSTGLYYPHSRMATLDEVAALAGAVKAFGGIYATHMRDEGAGLFASLDETFEIGRRADVPVIVSHLKCAAPSVWGKSADALARVQAEATQRPVAFDIYPYAASSTMLWPEKVEEARRIVVTWSEPHPEAAGRDLTEIAAEWECSKQEAAERLVPGGAILFKMIDADVERIIAHPDAMIGSDGLPFDMHPHPRLWGTFPRVLGHFASELGLMTLEEAVRKMTSRPAQVFGLKDRGVIAPGAYADITLFDPLRVRDRASFEYPTIPSEGIDWVFVNGRPVWRGGKSTGERSGRVLRRRIYRHAVADR